jgi:hypothetical protein
VNSLEGTCLPVDQVAYQQHAVGRTLPSKHIDAVVFFARLLTRPNKFFFLEPSTVSLFTATAAVIEMTYFRRVSADQNDTELRDAGFVVLLIVAPMLIVLL